VRTGILGGTFDPPHLGHLVLGAAAWRALDLNRVLFVPAGEPWRKQREQSQGEAISPAAARLRMVEAATAALPWAEVSTIEVDRAGPSYSLETVQALAAGDSDGEHWWLVVGADALEDLPHWHEPVRLVAAARFAVASRDGVLAGAPAELAGLVPDIAGRIDAVPMPDLSVASTDLRDRVRGGRPTDVLLPQTVREVVDELGLYRE
jgi:nicotinate-nucleotide adenylyltransferase